jgi:probable rRNA maturation factor
MNQVEFSAEEVPPPPWLDAAGSFVLKVLEFLGRDGWEVSVLFCNNRYIKSLNARYRNHDEATDVLSFALGETPAGGESPCLAGDIVISLDALEENVRFFRVPADEELRRLLVHGILHLDGGDHASNEPGEPMLAAQEKILGCLKDARILPKAAGNVRAKTALLENAL